MTDQPRPQGQLDVQRWLGRCMLRLQQYERLMKTLLAHHELAGPADTLEAQRAANLEKVSDKTLGTLVKSLFESYAVPDGFERELLPEDKVPTDRISMAISYRMTMATSASTTTTTNWSGGSRPWTKHERTWLHSPRPTPFTTWW